MPDYIFLMHNDTSQKETAEMWDRYIERLQSSGAFAGGSAFGDGEVLRKSGRSQQVSENLSGFIRIKAANLDEAKAHIVGNPVFECGGTVEVRLLTTD